MKKLLAIALALCMLFSLCACGSSAAETEKKDETVYKLTITNHDPETSATGRFLKKWADTVSEESGGRLQFDIYYGGTLGGVKETINLVNNGTADIGDGGQSTYAGMFPLSLVIALPMTGIETSKQASEIFWKLYENNEELQNEYKDYKVIALHANCGAPICFSAKEVDEISEFNSLNIRANSGPPASFITELGGSPISVAMGELYQALENNTVDGVMTDWHGLYSFKLYEAVKYILDVPVYFNAFYTLMNKESYEELPEDLQAIIDKYSGEGCLELIGDMWDEYETMSRDEISKAGKVKMMDPSAELTAQFETAAQNVWKSWIEEQNGLGYDGQGIFDQMMGYIAEY